MHGLGLDCGVKKGGRGQGKTGLLTKFLLRVVGYQSANKKS